jgi:hypothetical protein
MLSSPMKILFLNLIENILNKILDDKEQMKNLYFEYFVKFFKQLSGNNKNLIDMRNLIISNIKRLIYENVDNQSFRNPIVM